ncbi:MAG: hypothetical protein E7271_08275 [Lachnospiraceae bacterium]|jgi:GT2 family glycosyltransferase/glycosyltransferase involved in cell wall biosynthesis|nr:hypothetical protein [Lachnospiraceae bacterium]
MNIKKAILNIPGMKTFNTERLHSGYKALDKTKKKNYENCKYVPAEGENTPLVSVIIFVLNWDAKPDKLISSLTKCSFYINVEYILINYSDSNAVINDIANWKDTNNVTIVDNPGNETCTVLYNRAVSMAKGDKLLFIQSTLQVTDGFLDELLKTEANSENAGAIGAKIVYTDSKDENFKKAWKICHTGVDFKDKTVSEEFILQPYNMNDGASSYDVSQDSGERLALSGGILYVPKANFDKVGGFDERYSNTLYDIDLCLKLNQKGFTNYYCDDCLVYNTCEGIASLKEFKTNKKQKKQDVEVFNALWQAWLRYSINKETRDLDSKTVDICGAHPDNENTKFWGDYHYAMALKNEFEKRGYKVNVLSRENWYKQTNAAFVIVLRGLKEYYPEIACRDENCPYPRKKYIMWNISHPAEVGIREYNEYNYVFFASNQMKKMMQDELKVPLGVLLQCTDPSVMTSTEGNEGRYELLFVGNSRRVYRQILKDLLPTKYKLTVYGRHWEEFPVKDYVVSDYIDNNEVGQAYHDAKILLNDHWEDMKKYGIISNRIFDALSAGAFIISDNVVGIDEVLEGNVVTYDTTDDLSKKIDYYMEHDGERKEKALAGQKIVREKHTFANRVNDIIGVIEKL